MAKLYVTAQWRGEEFGRKPKNLAHGWSNGWTRNEGWLFRERELNGDEAGLNSSDAELLEDYRASGDSSVLGILIRRHVGLVRGTIFPMVVDESVTDDLTQEVFLKAVRGIHGFEGRASFSTWLCRIAVNTTQSFLSRQGRSPVSFCSEIPDPAGGDAPDQVAVHCELKQEIEMAIEELSPKLRAAISLISIQGRTVEEAAEIQQCSTSTMYWRIHEARKQLKNRLARHLS